MGTCPQGLSYSVPLLLLICSASCSARKWTMLSPCFHIQNVLSPHRSRTNGATDNGLESLQPWARIDLPSLSISLRCLVMAGVSLFWFVCLVSLTRAVTRWGQAVMTHYPVLNKCSYNSQLLCSEKCSDTASWKEFQGTDSSSWIAYAIMGNHQGEQLLLVSSTENI